MAEEQPLTDTDRLRTFLKDYKSMIYLLGVAESSSDDNTARESIVKSHDLAEKLEANPLLNSPGYELVKEDIHVIKEAFLRKR